MKALARRRQATEKLEVPKLARGSRRRLTTNRPAGSLIGQYTIVDHLDSGGMADIYLVTSPNSDAPVVLKCLRESHRHDDNYLRMMVDEARIMACFDHPNLVRVLDPSRAESGYFTMEYIQGAPLSKVFRTVLESTQVFPTDIALAVSLRIGAALHHAHELRDESGALRHVVHRDISMGNVLISTEGAVKLTDFGIVSATRRVTQTRAGYLKGKTGYMSPEQILAGTVDRRSDIFSLGVVMWELLAGERLYTGSSDYEKMKRIVHNPATPLNTRRPDLPSALHEVIHRALERDPARRYPTALAFVRAVDGVVGDDFGTSSTRIASWVSSALGSGPTDETSVNQAPDHDDPSIEITFDEDSESMLEAPDDLEASPVCAPSVTPLPGLPPPPKQKPRLASYLGYPNSADIEEFFRSARPR